MSRNSNLVARYRVRVFPFPYGTEVGLEDVDTRPLAKTSYDAALAVLRQKFGGSLTMVREAARPSADNFRASRYVIHVGISLDAKRYVVYAYEDVEDVNGRGRSVPGTIDTFARPAAERPDAIDPTRRLHPDAIDPTRRLHPDAADEIARLSNALDDMRDKLEAAEATRGMLEAGMKQWMDEAIAAEQEAKHLRVARDAAVRRADTYRSDVIRLNDEAIRAYDAMRKARETLEGAAVA